MKLKHALLGQLAVPFMAVSVMAASPSLDIVDTAVQAGQFKTLVSLVQKAGLVETLKSQGPFTVFAPTDAAFAKLPRAVVERLGADPALLKAVLTYHVLPGEVLSEQAIELAKTSPTMAQVPTVNGQRIRLGLMGGSLFINRSRVIKADILATNGVIHVIDRVLIPRL